MPDPAPDTTVTAAPPAAPAEQPAPAPVTFTAEQVAERERVAAQKAHDAAMAEARRVFEGKQRPNSSTAPTPQPAPIPASAPAPSGMTFQDLVRYDAYKAAIGEHAVPPAGQQMLLGQFMAAAPADPAAWVREQVTAFGWQKQATTTTPPATVTAPTGTPAATTPQPAPAPTPGGPTTAPASAISRRPLHEWTQAELDAYAAQNGGPRALFALFAADSASTAWSLRPKR